MSSTDRKNRAYRILLADDDDSYRTVLSSALRREGFEVDEVVDGQELQDQLERAIGGADVPVVDMVISDVHMPGRDGFEVLEWLRIRDRDLPFVLITSQDVGGMRDKANALGAQGLLDKAFELATLKSLIEKLCFGSAK